MASGSFNVTTSNTYIKGKTTWSSTSNGSSANTSDVTATLRLSRTNTGYTTQSSGTFFITINGTKSTSSNTQRTFTYNSNTLCHTFTLKNVPHNSDGRKSITITVGGTQSRFTMSNQSGTATLDTIPRYAKISNFTLSSQTCTQFNIRCSADRAVDVRQYRIGSGSWTNMGSETVTVTGRSPNTRYNVQVRVRSTASGLYTTSGTKSISTYRLNTAGGPTFSTGSSLTVNLSRASTSISSDVTLQMWADSQKWINVATSTQNSTSVTFSLSTAQLNTIYNNRVSSKTSEVRLSIVNRWGHGGTSQGTSYSSTGTVTIVNASPSIAGVSYKDTNSTVQSILNNNQKILRNLSTLQVTTGQATSQKGATLENYRVKIGGSEYSTSASGTSQTGGVINIGKVNQSANQTATLTVTDSRGYTASRSFTVQMLDYAVPQFIQASADRLNNYEQPTTMNINARRTIVKPASVDVNTVEMRYRIKQNPSGSYGSYINLVAEKGSASGIYQNANVSQYMSDYPNDQSYTVEVGIRDKFTGWNTILITLTEGIALLRYLQDRIEAGVPLVDQNTGQPYIFFTESEEW